MSDNTPQWESYDRDDGGVGVLPVRSDGNGDWIAIGKHTVNCEREYDCHCEPDVYWLSSDGMPLENGPVIIHHVVKS